MKSELISIIVLAYNSEQYITKCLNSILKQTYQNIEIIAVNNGSTDKTLNKITRIANRDSRIKIISLDEKNSYEAIKKAYRLSKGKYISFVYAYDFITNKMIEIMYQNIKENKDDVVRCQYKKYENDSITIPKNILNRNVIMNVEQLEPQFFDLLYKTNHCNKLSRQLIKKTCAKNIIKLDRELNDYYDIACNIELYKNMKSILFIPDELYILNNNYKKEINKENINQKIDDDLYSYYKLFLSVKEFEIKDRKKYKTYAAIRFMKKLSYLFSSLTELNIPKKDVIKYYEEILEDKRVVEIKKVLEGKNISDICLDIKRMNKPTINIISMLMDNKLNALYRYDKMFFNFYKKINY